MFTVPTSVLEYSTHGGVWWPKSFHMRKISASEIRLVSGEGCTLLLVRELCMLCSSRHFWLSEYSLELYRRQEVRGLYFQGARRK